ncbi:hypothetical protein HBH56_042310 [Parastagonospora nodorum]|uniref:Uncharacterized protein n=1 Tax=Phaeosphaeria nodorum (strain SN15 / ATCC MYA-4574 / FGSC 10173) TaxID=321614 RepID=A0A7U2HY46_PHANO|nr:hypothetical protein HBH56_042310 [Parastagonospora nodorum]QRC92941.1 hypothetical protein JI435_080150 [Parastagonospora nodorum SN15]KAH3933093.1 hypothetical protein HBH54_070060 [Parastagonospora nodorum]KAH3943562.1 hypothetical protein HBH53_174230 [Parastagonospora nodorum]KAH3961829.1 hypothetical protein HBH52_229450 [Parastagonospora nodorum]
MAGDPMECASPNVPEDRTPLWILPGLLSQGTTTGSIPQDFPFLTQDIPHCDTASSQEGQSFTSTDTVELSNRPALPYYTLPHQAIPQIMSGYVSMEQYERAMKHSVKLAQELMRAREQAKKAREETEQAKLAFCMLADWTYHERQMLLDKLASTRLDTEEHIKAGHQEIGDVLVDDFKVTDTVIAENSGGGEEYEPSEFIRGSSLDDAIDQLIAEEKAKLTYASL